MTDIDSTEESLTPEQEILLGWWEVLQSEDKDAIDNYLSSIVSPEGKIRNKQSSSSPHKPIWLPYSVSCCRLSYPSTGALGHYQLTKHNLESEGGWSEQAIENFARASVLPDLLFFDEMKYHAQSNSDNNGLLFSKNGELDLANFTKFLQEELSILYKSFNSNDLHNIFFSVGILFHAVQDLSCHQGMSNPEHALLNKNNESPDSNNLRCGFAKQVNELFSKKFIWNKLNSIKNDLNNTDTISWHSFLKTRANTSVVLKEISTLPIKIAKFKFSVPNILSIANQARWYLWQCPDDDTDALEQIDSKIFSKLI